MTDTTVKLARIVARKTESSISAETIDGMLVRDLAHSGMSALDLAEAVEREFRVKLAPAMIGKMTLGQVAAAIDGGEAKPEPCCKCAKPGTTTISEVSGEAGKPAVRKAYCETHLAELPGRGPAKGKAAA